jgi:hypothetical protein
MTREVRDEVYIKQQIKARKADRDDHQIWNAK